VGQNTRPLGFAAFNFGSMIRSAPNLTQINVILFLALPHNLLKSTLENKVAHLANDNSHNKRQIFLMVLFNINKKN